jgi:dTDP-glucose pyrophosphorylase
MSTPTPVEPLEDVLVRYALGPGATMRDALSCIDRNGEGVALVVDADRRLHGIVTDGDIRRALLAGLDFDQPLGDYLRTKTGPGPRDTLTAPLGTADEDLLRLMDRARVRHLPLVNDEGRLAGLALMSRLGRDSGLPVRAVVMAGGFGKRLRPFTDDTPKPLLTVGEKPVIERIVEKLRDSGIRRLSITTHYRAEQIIEHFGDGSGFGVEVRYTHETEPMGTAGALALVGAGDEPVLVINGDIVTDVDFRAMLDFHCEHRSAITVGVRRYELAVPFGVVEGDGARVTRLVEKPALSFFINAGIYLLEPAIIRRIPPRQRLDMTDLIQRLLDEGGTVTSFPIHEYWADIGQLRDYFQVQADVRAGRVRK